MSIQSGDIYFVNLNPIKGREQAGSRPLLLLALGSVSVSITVRGTSG